MMQSQASPCLLAGISKHADCPVADSELYDCQDIGTGNSDSRWWPLATGQHCTIARATRTSAVKAARKEPSDSEATGPRASWNWRI